MKPHSIEYNTNADKERSTLPTERSCALHKVKFISSSLSFRRQQKAVEIATLGDCQRRDMFVNGDVSPAEQNEQNPNLKETLQFTVDGNIVAGGH